MVTRFIITLVVLLPFCVAAQSNIKMMNDTVLLPYKYGVIIQNGDTIDIVVLTSSNGEHLLDIRPKESIDETSSHFYSQNGVKSIKKVIKYVVKSNGDTVWPNSASYDSVFSKKITHKSYLETDLVDTIYNCINWGTKIPKNLECTMETYQEYYDYINYPLYFRRLFYTYHLHKMNETALNVDSTPKLRVLFPENSDFTGRKVYGLNFSIYSDSIVCINKAIDVCDVDYYKVSHYKLKNGYDKKMRSLLNSLSDYSGYDMTQTIGFVSNPVLIEYFDGEKTTTYLIDKEFDKPDKKLWNIYNGICQLAMIMVFK